MYNFGLILALGLGALSALFYAAADAPGDRWAYSLCNTAMTFCQHPQWPGIAAGVLVCIVVVMKMATASR